MTYLFNVTDENSEEMLMNALRNPNGFNVLIAYNCGFVDEENDLITPSENLIPFVKNINSVNLYFKIIHIFQHDDVDYLINHKLHYHLNNTDGVFSVLYCYYIGVRVCQLKK